MWSSKPSQVKLSNTLTFVKDWLANDSIFTVLFYYSISYSWADISKIRSLDIYGDMHGHIYGDIYGISITIIVMTPYMAYDTFMTFINLVYDMSVIKGFDDGIFGILHR